LFARALFLLRLSSSIVRGQWLAIQQQNAMAGYPNTLAWQNDFLFQYSKCANLWFDDGTPPPSNDYSILASDHNDALYDVESWLTSSPFSRYDIWNTIPGALVQLSRLDRLGVIAINAT